MADFFRIFRDIETATDRFGTRLKSRVSEFVHALEGKNTIIQVLEEEVKRLSGRTAETPDSITSQVLQRVAQDRSATATIGQEIATEIGHIATHLIGIKPNTNPVVVPAPMQEISTPTPVLPFPEPLVNQDDHFTQETVPDNDNTAFGWNNPNESTEIDPTTVVQGGAKESPNLFEGLRGEIAPTDQIRFIDTGKISDRWPNPAGDTEEAGRIAERVATLEAGVIDSTGTEETEPQTGEKTEEGTGDEKPPIDPALPTNQQPTPNPEPEPDAVTNGEDSTGTPAGRRKGKKATATAEDTADTASSPTDDTGTPVKGGTGEGEGSAGGTADATEGSAITETPTGDEKDNIMQNTTGPGDSEVKNL